MKEDEVGAFKKQKPQNSVIFQTNIDVTGKRNFDVDSTLDLPQRSFWPYPRTYLIKSLES
ncbi:hypothetical protein [Tropicibacter sp. Alg240-R139]|uniref:hypothetical protein n=1 Tax=Tropicibacter sp. Alg240-R139 TaxID=2305991 RepID=UPI0013DF61A9|nr:hypothetical protein [Tropicibacter sp. Alg240-R139]